MKGKQQAAYEQVLDIAAKVFDGFYGEDDDFKPCPFFDDFEDIHDYLLEDSDNEEEN